MATHRTPDVYVEEILVRPPSVAEVGTAIPAFIGYTGKASDPARNDDLLGKPTKIYSLKEYEDYFGLPKPETITVSVVEDAAGALTVSALTVPPPSHLLYYAVRMFFDNGGSQCYIVSAGGYGDAVALSAATGTKGLQVGLDRVAQEDEPTLIVIPEAVRLSATDYTTLVQAVLLQCERLKDRFAIFDIHGGGGPLNATELATERGYFGNNSLKYGAAYYPFLRTTLHPFISEDETNVDVTVAANPAANLGTFASSNTRVYNFVKAHLDEQQLIMPPSGAVAGVYAAVDAARGVWKAPANVSLADVVEPVVKLENLKQDDLKVDADAGKSINAIRAFAGKGTLVWGARTMAGNDNEWRYVSVRRFFNLVEESIRKSTCFTVFEPNEAHTWGKVRGLIENYLTDKWREGALAGTTTRDAFYVKCGLGSTISAQDILEGRLIVEVGMAVVRPAEFITLRFSHQLQPSNTHKERPPMGTDPLPVFRVLVDFGGQRMGFSEVSGLTRENQAIEHRDGAFRDDSSIKMPGLRKFSNITLKRGTVQADTEFLNWLNAGELNKVERRDVTISLLNEEHEPVMTWTVMNAFPVKVEGPRLNASGNDVAIESIELAHEGLTQNE